MEEDARQRLELTRTSIDMTRRSGLLREIFSLLHSGRLQETPEEQPEYRERTIDALSVNGGGMLGHWGGVKLYHLVRSCPAKKSELTGQHKYQRQLLREMP